MQPERFLSTFQHLSYWLMAFKLQNFAMAMQSWYDMLHLWSKLWAAWNKVVWWSEASVKLQYRYFHHFSYSIVSLTHFKRIVLWQQNCWHGNEFVNCSILTWRGTRGLRYSSLFWNKLVVRWCLSLGCREGDTPDTGRALESILRAQSLAWGMIW